MTGGPLRVHIRLFAMQRELAGTRSVDVSLADDATIEDAWTALVDRFPVLAPGRPAVRFARNGAYAPADTVLADGDEVAMIPPVSGGADDATRILELREGPFDPSILAEIADEIEARFGVSRLAIVHREGDVPLGQPSVAIVACAPHRDAAFEAARYAIDETKHRAPIWKAEHFEDGHVWIGEPARESPRAEV